MIKPNPRRAITATAVLVGLLLPLSAGASEQNGSRLLVWCTRAVQMTETPAAEVFRNPPELVVEASWCTGYVQGAYQLNAVLPGLGRKSLWCPPDRTVEYRQLYRILVRWLSDNPKMLHHHGIALTILAFQDAFPCP